MALKVTIDATEFAALSDDLKKEYQVQPDFSYKLDLGGLYTDTEDPAKLKSALAAEREETKKAKAAADRLEKEANDAKLAKTTDVEELKTHYAEELRKVQKTFDDERKKAAQERLDAQTAVANQHLNTQAMTIASDLFGTNAALMLPHVQQRLQAVPGDQPGLQIIDPITGQPSLDQDLGNFKESLSTNPAFAPMVVVSKASGGGANGGNKSTELPNAKTDDGKTKTWHDYDETELVALKANDNARFQALKSTIQ